MKIKEITEAVVTQFQPGRTAQIQDKEKGVTYNLDLTNPQNMAALHPGEQGGLELDLTQQQGTQGAQQQPTIQPGAEVTIGANESQGESNYELTLDIDNPNWNPDDENSYDTLRVGVNYSIFGEHSPETWGYHGGSPEEHPEIDELSVVDLDTGEDITNDIDTSEIEAAIWKHERSQEHGVGETIGGDPTDEFIDDVRDKEFEKANKNESAELDHIRKLSGL